MKEINKDCFAKAFKSVNVQPRMQFFTFDEFTFSLLDHQHVPEVRLISTLDLDCLIESKYNSVESFSRCTSQLKISEPVARWLDVRSKDIIEEKRVLIATNQSPDVNHRVCGLPNSK